MSSTHPSRRNFLHGFAGAIAAAGLVQPAQLSAETVLAPTPQSTQPQIIESDTISNFQTLKLKGNIKHSLVNWCYKQYFKSLDDYCQMAVRLGCKSIELIPPEDWPTLKKHGLTCAIAGSHGFPVGFNNKQEWASCTDALIKSITACKEFGVKSVISFTGMANGLSKEEGGQNFVEGIKKAVAFAEKNEVTICLEVLNTRDSTHKMKGHPGYQGDHCDYCIDLIKKVGSPHLKLLFDVYHVQIMDGDVIRRLREHHEFIGHIHTAGNPGRGELDQSQEINYPAIMQALVDLKYTGYVGHEFIPTRDVVAGLNQAVQVCDV